MARKSKKARRRKTADHQPRDYSPDPFTIANTCPAAASSVEASHVELLAARELLSRFSALLFLDPLAGAWQKLEALRDEKDLLLGASSVLARVTSAPSAEVRDDPFGLSAVWDQFPASREALVEQFQRTFGLVVAGAHPAYATEYLPAQQSVQRSQMLADLAGFYRAFGLQPAAGRSDRPDSLVWQLQFLAWLFALERQALERSDPKSPEQIAVCCDARRRFVEDYVAFWLPTFCRSLRADQNAGFYCASAQFVGNWFDRECTLLGIQVRNTTDLPSPSFIEPAECCTDCVLGSRRG